MKKYIATWSVHKERAHSHTHMNFRYVFLDFCLSFCMSFYVFYDRISKNTWDSCAQPNAQPSLSRVLWLVCTIPTCLYNYIYIYIYIYLHTYIYIDILTHTYIYIYIYTHHIHTYIYIWHWVSHTVLPNVHLHVAAIAAGPSPWTSWNPKVRRAGPQSSVIRDLYGMARYTTYIYNITWRYSV